MNSFTHTIVYVLDVEQALDFYERAFGCKRKFLHESGAYGELETGSTTLAFASEELAKMNFPTPIETNRPEKQPAAIELVFTTDDVEKTLAAAMNAGAIELTSPTQKPWGQTVAYIRDPFGVLVEIASPIS